MTLADREHLTAETCGDALSAFVKAWRRAASMPDRLGVVEAAVDSYAAQFPIAGPVQVKGAALLLDHVYRVVRRLPASPDDPQCGAAVLAGWSLADPSMDGVAMALGTLLTACERAAGAMDRSRRHGGPGSGHSGSTGGCHSRGRRGADAAHARRMGTGDWRPAHRGERRRASAPIGFLVVLDHGRGCRRQKLTPCLVRRRYPGKMRSGQRRRLARPRAHRESAQPEPPSRQQPGSTPPGISTPMRGKPTGEYDEGNGLHERRELPRQGDAQLYGRHSVTRLWQQ